uniref:(northern house mosquito) hypothetical protein n=2 Tax=Culex pipiens TaxID=7175 RepID=A0A8D8I8X5_CULPI
MNRQWILKCRMRQTKTPPTVRCRLRSFQLKKNHISAMSKTRVCKMRSNVKRKSLIALTAEWRFSQMRKNNATWCASVQFCTIKKGVQKFKASPNNVPVVEGPSTPAMASNDTFRCARQTNLTQNSLVQTVAACSTQRPTFPGTSRSGPASVIRTSASIALKSCPTLKA